MFGNMGVKKTTIDVRNPTHRVIEKASKLERLQEELSEEEYSYYLKEAMKGIDREHDDEDYLAHLIQEMVDENKEEKMVKFEGDSVDETIWVSEAERLVQRLPAGILQGDASDIIDAMFDHIQDRIRSSELNEPNYSAPEEEKIQVKGTEFYKVLIEAISTGHGNPGIADDLEELLD
jgi:preprotein translocase subunit SecD